MGIRATLIVLAWVCLVFAAQAQPITFPALTSSVVDQAGLLDASDRAILEAALSDLEAKTTDQMVVVTLKSLQGISIEDYGYQLGRRWGIGQQGKNNGLLLIVAAAERTVRFEVGYGLEGTLTDALTKLIIETAVLPKFKAGDVPGGIKLGVQRVIQVLNGGDAAELQSPTVVPGSGARRPAADIPLWPAIVLGVLGVAMLIFCLATQGGALCQALMQIIFLMLLSGRGGSSRGNSSSGGGGSFGGGGSAGGW
jgi:uncharacterized protein